MDAPLNAAQAASQVAEIWGDLYEARNAAETYAMAAAKIEHLYRTCKSRALIDPECGGSNREARDAAAHEWPVDGDRRVAGTKVAEAIGMPGTTPESVGDLRWLRDRVQAMADASSARAYDVRARLQAWMTVTSMAKAEAELAPPERMAS